MASRQATETDGNNTAEINDPHGIIPYEDYITRSITEKKVVQNNDLYNHK